MGSPCIIRAISRDTGDVFILRDLLQKHWQNRGITDLVSRHFNGADFQRAFVNSNMKFAPVPFAFSLDLDPGAVDQKMKRTVRTAIGDIDRQGFLPTTQRAEIRHRPCQPRQAQEAFDKARRLSQGKSKQNLQRQTGLDRSIAVTPLTTAAPRRKTFPIHGRVKPHRQTPTLLQCCVVGGPVRRSVARALRLAHHSQLTNWIQTGNPLPVFLQQSRQDLLIHGILLVIPSRKGRSVAQKTDWRRYRERNRIERMFNKLKQMRRIATRYDKTALSFMSFLPIAAARFWIRSFVNVT